MSITCKPFFYKIKPKLITKHIQNAIALIRQFKDYVRQVQRRNDSQYKPMMCKMLIVACWRRYAKTDHIGCLSKVMDNVAARRAHRQPDLSKPAETKADKSRKSHQHRCKTGSPLTRRELLWLCFFVEHELKKGSRNLNVNEAEHNAGCFQIIFRSRVLWHEKVTISFGLRWDKD